MKIIVVGCGKIGTTIIHNLVSEGHDVVALDYNAEIINDITNMYDVMGICGNATDYETLVEAGVKESGLFVAVTSHDELNMLSCRIAKKMGAGLTVARIRNPEYNGQSLDFMCDVLDISKSINPELLAAHEIFNILKFPSAVKVEYFSRGNFEMIELKLRDNSILDGMSLMDLRNKYKSKVLISAVQRDDKVVIPDGRFVLKSADRISITATPSEIQSFLNELGLLQKKARNIMILGGSKIAYYLSKMLLNEGNTVKIIEQKRERCLELCDALPNAVIINGDGAEQELLFEEGITELDAFVSLTGMDEENILISIFAASQNVPKVISKVNRTELAAMAEKLGLDTIVSPKDTTANIIVRYARAVENSLGSSVETLYKLMDGQAEALEFNVRNDFEHINIPFKDLEFKSNILIAGIIRGKESIIPGGNDYILPGDNVIVLASGHKLNDLSDIIK
ncbi:MAG: Trk system potassium transporter TrkA [Lachnospiraceae bacterium]|nr:Trk system potassium transporter TrkA [Lachnospiraceae bacterium]